MYQIFNEEREEAQVVASIFSYKSMEYKTKNISVKSSYFRIKKYYRRNLSLLWNVHGGTTGSRLSQDSWGLLCSFEETGD